MTRVAGWQQLSLFTREQLKPYAKNRWKWIRARLLEEDRVPREARVRQNEEERR